MHSDIYLEIVKMKYTPEEQQQIDLLNLNAYNFTRFKNPSENVQQYAVSLRGDLIHYIKNPSSEVQRLAISNDGVAAYYIDNPADDLLGNPEVIRSIKRTTAAMIKTGIHEDVIIRYLERVSRFNIPELEKIAASIVKHRVLSRKPIAESRDLNSMSELEQIAAVKKDWRAISYIQNPSLEVQLAAVQQNGGAIRNIWNPGERVQIAAVQENGLTIRFIKNPSPTFFTDPEVKRAIVRALLVSIKSGRSIEDILDLLDRHQVDWSELKMIRSAATRTPITESRDLNSMSELEQIAAVKQNGWAIEYIQNSSLRVQLAAVNQNGYAIEYIDNPSEQVQLAAVKQNGWAIEYIQNSSLEVQLAAVQQNGGAIGYIPNPVLEVQLAAVEQNGHAIYHIRNPGLQVQLAAVKQNGWTIRYIQNPSLEVQLAAVLQYGGAIRYIPNPGLQVQLAAVKQDSYAIRHIRNPGLQVQLAAVKENGATIQLIQNPSPELFANTEAKTAIVRELLVSIKSGYSIDDILDFLDRHRVAWDELKKIRAVTEKKPIAESRDLNSMSEEEQIRLVEYLPYSISKITNPSERVQLAAVSIEGDVIKYISNPSKEVKLAAVRNRGRAIAYIEDPDEDIKRTAVTENGYSIRYISNPSLLIQMTAIDDASGAIRYIKNPIEQIQLYAVNKASYSIEDIEFPTKRVQRTAILTNAECIRLIRNIDVELFDDPKIKTAIIKKILELVKENFTDPVLHILRILNDNNVDWPEMERLNKIPDIMERKPITETLDFDSMSEEEQIRKVFATYGYAIRSIRNPSERVQLAAVQLNGFLIQFIYQKGIEPSEQVKRAALEYNGNAIAYITNPSEELQIIAVRNAGDSIAEIQKAGITPSRRVMEEAVRSHPWAIVYIDQPDDNLQRLVLTIDPLIVSRIPNLNLSLLEEDAIKRQIIKGILQGILADKNRTVDWVVSFLETHGFQWPELEKIKSVLNRKGIS
jgi:hypothetical protein